MVNRLWQKLSHLGVLENEHEQKREVILLNKIGVFAILLILCFIPIEIILNGFELVPVELISAVIFSSILLLNSFRFHTAAKYFSIISGALLILISSFVVGGESDSEYNLLPVFLLPLLFFRNFIHITLLSLFVAVCFFYLKFSISETTPLVEIPIEVRKKVQPFMNLMTMMFLFFELYYFKKLNLSFEKNLSRQKLLVEQKNHEITSSIKYAKRIQSAILPPNKLVKEFLSNSFILYKPKDIVAGDFYWLEHKEGKVLFAAADCTGHGVPGAKVSVICNNGLNRSVREYGLTEPGKILNKTREIVIAEFEKSEEEVKDGMDIALCSLDGNKLEYAGANNPLWIVRHAELDAASEKEQIPNQVRNDEYELIEINADKQPIGKYAENKPYTTHKIELQKGDSIYIFTDGYADQFGGEKSKKFKAANFKKLLLSIQEKPMEEQKIIIDQTFKDWKGNLEQIDDVCIIGVRI